MTRLWLWSTLLLLPSRAVAKILPTQADGLRTRLATVSVPFIVNDGQVDGAVAYYAPTFAGTVYVTSGGRIVYSLPAREAVGTTRVWSLTETATGGRARPSGDRPALARVSYFNGNDPTRWRNNIGTYESVSLGEVWPGVSVSLRAQGKNVEKLFTVAPGADPSRVLMTVEGALSLQVGQSGALVASTGLGDVVFTRPAAYQKRDGVRRPVSVAYRLLGRQYGFLLGEYDHSLPLVIDPLLRATYLGGGGPDRAFALAIHPISGEVLIAGRTEASNFPGTAGGAQPASGGGFDEAFVARLNAALTTLTQATYLGGSSYDEANALAIHPTSGEVFIAGKTASTNFPGTTGGAQPAHGGGDYDAFVARLNATLTTLEQATYLGGSGIDGTGALAIHPTSGEVFIGGETFSSDLPSTAGGAQPTYGGNDDAFVARLNATLTTLAQSTYLGGTSSDVAFALAIHPTSGEVFVGGQTFSTDFPGTAGGALPTKGGSDDAFVARLNASLTTLAQGTYLGGSGAEYALALAIHPSSGEVFVAGGTFSTDFPGTAGGAQPAQGGGPLDAFVARLNATLTTLVQATYLGGSGSQVAETATALAFRLASGEVFVAGQTDSTDFPGTAGGAQSVIEGSTDAFVARLNSALTTLTQATYLGGSSLDFATALTIDPTSGEVLVAGGTLSTNFPAAAGGAQAASGGFEDAFVARMTADLAGVGLPTPTPTAPAAAIPTLSSEVLALAALVLASLAVLLLNRGR